MGSDDSAASSAGRKRSAFVVGCEVEGGAKTNFHFCLHVKMSISTYFSLSLDTRIYVRLTLREIHAYRYPCKHLGERDHRRTWRRLIATIHEGKKKRREKNGGRQTWPHRGATAMQSIQFLLSSLPVSHSVNKCKK